MELNLERKEMNDLLREVTFEEFCFINMKECIMTNKVVFNCSFLELDRN